MAAAKWIISRICGDLALDCRNAFTESLDSKAQMGEDGKGMGPRARGSSEDHAYWLGIEPVMEGQPQSLGGSPDLAAFVVPDESSRESRSRRLCAFDWLRARQPGARGHATRIGFAHHGNRCGPRVWKSPAGWQLKPGTPRRSSTVSRTPVLDPGPRTRARYRPDLSFMRACITSSVWNPSFPCVRSYSATESPA